MHHWPWAGGFKNHIMLIFISILLVVFLFAPDFYIYYTFLSNQPIRLISICYWLPQIIVIALILFFAFEDNQSVKFRHIGYASFVLLCLQLPKLVFSICSMIGKIIGLFHIPNQAFTILGLIIGIATLLTLLYGCFIELYNFKVKHVELTYSNLPKKFNGYKIVHISDIHIGSWNKNGKKLEKAISLVNEQKADIVCFTGDLVTNNHTEVDAFYSTLQSISAKDGVYSILGNHDYSFVMSSRDTLKKLIEKEKNIGWRLLLDEHEIITRGDEEIAILGVENVGRSPFPHIGNLSKASRETDGMFRILLSHDPTHWREEVIPQTDIALTLSGHTHAGQCDLPFLSISKKTYPEYRGLYSEGNQFLYVNPGLGFTFFPIRIGTRPEITVITLISD